MKNCLILPLLILNGFLVNAQYFEGTIEYDYSYTLKDESLDESIFNESGTHGISYFKDGLIKEISDSKYMSYYLLYPKKNRIYYKHDMKDDTLRFNSTFSKETPEKFEYQLFEGTDTILGVICDKLIVFAKYSTNTYYFSSEYPLDPECYKNHNIDNKDKIVNLMKAVYLKLVMDFRAYEVEVTATNINPIKLNKKTFKIPKHSHLLEINY